jgi:hypothetical protein
MRAAPNLVTESLEARLGSVVDATSGDVGRGTLMPAALSGLGLARYERVVLNAIEAKPLLLATETWTPVAIRGWSRIVFGRDRDGAPHRPSARYARRSARRLRLIGHRL